MPSGPTDSTAQSLTQDRALDILVIEPDTDLGTSLRDTLRERGDRVLLLGNSLVALSHLNGRFVDGLPLPDLLLTDVNIPGLAELDLVALLRRSGFLMPIIVTTATASAKLRTRARDLGVLAVLERPFDFQDLLSMVEALRESR